MGEVNGLMFNEERLIGDWGLVLVQRYGTKMAHSKIERDRAR